MCQFCPVLFWVDAVVNKAILQTFVALWIPTTLIFVTMTQPPRPPSGHSVSWLIPVFVQARAAASSHRWIPGYGCFLPASPCFLYLCFHPLHRHVHRKSLMNKSPAPPALFPSQRVHIARTWESELGNWDIVTINWCVINAPASQT